MKILLVGEWYPPLRDWYFDEGNSNGMPAVRALYDYLGNSPEHTFYGLVYNTEKDYVKRFSNGSMIELRKLSFPIYFLWKLMAMFKMVHWASTISKEKNYNICYGLGSFAQVAQRVGNRNKLFSVGRIYGTILTKLFASSNYLKIYTRHLFDIIYIKNPSDFTICTFDGTEYDKIVKKINPKMNLKLLFNGMNAEMREQLLELPLNKKCNEDKIRFSYIARFEYYKRPELAIELMNQLVNHHKKDNYHLTLLGKGSLQTEIENKIKEQGLEDYITINSGINHDQIPSFLSLHDVSLFFYEGGSLGNALWESAIGGRLICTINNGATTNVIHDGSNGLVVDDNEESMKELANKIIRLSGEDFYEIARKGREDVSQKVPIWEGRFDKEFDRIEKELKK